MPQRPSTPLHACSVSEENDAASLRTTSNAGVTPHRTFALYSSDGVKAAHSAASPLPRSYCLHYDFVEGALESKADTLDRCTFVLVYLVFVIGFCFYFLYDVDVSARYQLRHSLLDTLSHAEMPRLKSAAYFGEVASAKDYAEYIVYAVAPLLANVLSPTGSSIPLGAMRVRTQRSVTNGCEDLQSNPTTSLYTIITCADNSVSAQEDTLQSGETRFDLEAMWTYRSCAELKGSRYALLPGVLGSYHCGGFVFDAPLWIARDKASSGASASAGSASTSSSSAGSDDISPTASPALGTAQQAFPFTEGTLPYERVSLARLQNDFLHPLFWEASTPFVDNYATRMVVTEMLFYNPPLQLFATMKLMGEVTSSGSWKTTSLLRVARVWTREDVGKGVFDVVVMFFVVLWIVWFGARAALFVKRRVMERGGGDGGAGGGRRVRDATGLSYSSVATVRAMAAAEYLFDAQNLYTLIILCLLVTTAGLRIAEIVYCARSLPRLDAIIYQDSYPAQFDYLFYLTRVQLYLNAVLVILLFYRGLCFVTVDTHVARVVHVVARAQAVLFGYLCMSLVCTTAFAVTLAALHGNSIWAFRNVDSAFDTLIRVLVRQQDISAITRDADNPLLMAFVLFSYYFLAWVVVLSLGAAIMVHGITEIRKTEPSPVLAAYQIQWLLHRMRACLSKPRLWPSFAWRWCTGFGDAALLRHAARCLRVYRKAKYPALDHVEGEVRQVVNFDDFTEAMHYLDNVLAAPRHTSRARSSGHRGGIWMTWTTRSTSETSSTAAAPQHSGGSNSLGSVISSPKTQPSLSGTPYNIDSSNSASAELAKSRASEEAREWMRRQWQHRWGAYTPAEVWSDVSRDWLASTTSEAALHYREEVVWLRNGVQAAAGDNLSHAKKFPQRLAELERKLKLLESHFRENELTSVASDKADRDERSESAA